MQDFSCLYLIPCLVFSNVLMFCIIKFHNTVLLINRNIVTYLNNCLVISVNICTSIQVNIIKITYLLTCYSCVSVLLRIFYGPLHLYIAISFRSLFFVFLFLFHGIVFSINLFRIIIVFKVSMTKK